MMYLLEQGWTHDESDYFHPTVRYTLSEDYFALISDCRYPGIDPRSRVHFFVVVHAGEKEQREHYQDLAGAKIFAYKQLGVTDPALVNEIHGYDYDTFRIIGDLILGNSPES